MRDIILFVVCVHKANEDRWPLSALFEQKLRLQVPVWALPFCKPGSRQTKKHLIINNVFVSNSVKILLNQSKKHDCVKNRKKSEKSVVGNLHF